MPDGSCLLTASGHVQLSVQLHATRIVSISGASLFCASSNTAPQLTQAKQEATQRKILTPLQYCRPGASKSASRVESLGGVCRFGRPRIAVFTGSGLRLPKLPIRRPTVIGHFQFLQQEPWFLCCLLVVKIPTAPLIGVSPHDVTDCFPNTSRISPLL